MTHLIGLSIGGRYHIVEQLGQGGMATVYKAYDTRLERTVAIKLIRRGAVPEEQITAMQRRFEREAKAVAQLTHPNIVHVFDYGDHEGAPYLVMEYLPGGSLKDRTGKPMPYLEAARLLLPVARALEYAHQRSIIHRDVKPANILITEHNTPMLSDFGIAKVLEKSEATQLTSTGVGIGTPEYMPPEQWTGNPVRQTDIYALGVVFFELVTGRKPFIADTPAALLLKHVSDPLPRPRIFVPDLPIEVENILFKALAKKAEERYANMGAFAGALESLFSLKGEDAARKPTVIEKEKLVDGRPVSMKDNEVGPRAQPTAPRPAERFPVPPPYYSTGSGQPGTGEDRDEGESDLQPSKSSKTWWWVLGGIGLTAVLAVFVGAVLLLARGISLSGGNKAASATAAAMAVSQSKTPAPSRTPTPSITPTVTPTFTPTFFMGATSIAETDGMVLLYVSEGKFLMGSDASEANSNADEIPRHWVYLDAFWIDRTEVSNAMYAQCVADGACSLPGFTYSGNRRDYYSNPDYADYPVVYVTWNQANRYCAWAGRRLPTEAEWEKAARGTGNLTYPWGSEISCTLANTRGCVGNTAAVGSYPQGASPYGALNMAGNVSEWVADFYDEAYYAISPDTNPTGPAQGSFRILRGGAWWYLDRGARTATRLRYHPENGADYIGFRCALTP